jgi:hypothetical protein
MSYTTHFLDDASTPLALDTIPVTLCGLPIEAIILNDRPATCPTCSDAHANEGWTFPLPATVTA